MVIQQGRREKNPEAYPLGYVEDLFEPRTRLGAIFSVPYMLKYFSMLI